LQRHRAGKADTTPPRHRFLEPIHNVKEGPNAPDPPANRRNSDLHLLESGGASRDRTDDLKLAKLALSQLSYGPDLANVRKVRTDVRATAPWWAEKELNLRPHAYQACALTT
jgi:hypothetical protein